MSRSIDYEGLAVLESADTKQPVDIKIHVTSSHLDAEAVAASPAPRHFEAIEIWVKEDVVDLLVETDTVTVLARSPVGGFAIVTGFHLDMVEPLTDRISDSVPPDAPDHEPRTSTAESSTIG